MGEEEISITTWEEYLNDLYEWIQEKYKLFEEDSINEEEYNEHLSYYMKEKDRIESIISNLVNNGDPEATPNSEHLTQEAFEEFFGVKLEEELSRIDKEMDRKLLEEVVDQGSEQEKEAEAQIWEMLSETSYDGDLTDTSRPSKNINILLIGDSGVGRTSLRRSWMGKHFIENHLTTIGASIEKKIIQLDNISCEVTVTDLGGQDFYSGLRRNFYRNIDGAVLVFDLTRPETFRRLDFWIKEMYREIRKLVPFILVGNKKNSKSRKIPEKYGIRASAQFSRSTLPKFRVRYMETSAKNSENVGEVFDTICREIIELKSEQES